MGRRNAYYPIPVSYSGLSSKVRRDYLHEESFLILPTALKTFNPQNLNGVFMHNYIFSNEKVKPSNYTKGIGFRVVFI